jgi:ABC-type transport system involved in cytochrome c biogenesis permease component
MRRRLASPFLAALWYALRVTVPPKRRALLLLPFVATVLFGFLAAASKPAGGEADLGGPAAAGLFGLVLPFACLVVGDAVLGAEVRTGALAITWLSPLPFWQLVLARWLGGWLLASLVLVPAMAAAAVVAGVPSAAGALAIAAAAGTAGYLALFVLVGVTTRRAALWSLGIVLLGERLLGTVLSGIAQVSPQWLARSTFGGLGPAEDLVRRGVPSGWSAVGRLALLTAIFLLVAERRIRHLRLAPAAD